MKITRMPLKALPACCESAYQLILISGDRGHNDGKGEIIV